jgi:Uma2 family endonuclease
VVVSCDERDQDFTAVSLRYPKLVIEVLSDSAASTDRGEKAGEYRAIETLEEYVLIDSRKRWAEVYSNTPDGRWVVSLPTKGGDLHLRSLDLNVDLDAIYDRFAVEASP